MQQPIDPLVANLVDRLNDNLREANLPRAHAECLALLNVLVSHPECAAAVFDSKSA